MNELGNTPADKNYKPSGISKAEERALEFYPMKDFNKEPNYLHTCDSKMLDKVYREVFMLGYHQAEKDLALTIEDIERIDIMLCGTRANKHGAFTFSKLSDEQYAEVLKRYLEAKQ